MSSKNRTCFGVSFGDTNLCIAVHKDGRTDVVANDSGDRTTPAVVNFSSQEVCVGLPAKNRLARQPKATVTGVKNILGSSDPSLCKFASSVPCTSKGDSLSFAVTGDGDGDKPYTKTVTTEDILTLQLKKLHDIAQNLRKDELFPCVISVPCHFTPDIRKTVTECAEKSGFHVLRLINEPSAALLPYINQLNSERKTAVVLVYRLGGESSDVSILNVTRSVIRTVVSKRFYNIGGNLWTMDCAKYATEEFKRKYKVSWEDLSSRSKSKVLSAAETAKHVLSTLESCSCSAESIHEGIDMNVQLTRARFEISSQNHTQEARNSILEVLKSQNIGTNQIDMVILSGGGCRMTSIQKFISSEFPKAQISKLLAPEEVNAIGASMEADLLLSRGAKNDDVHLNSTVELKTLSKSISVQLKDGSEMTIIPKGSVIPLMFESPILLTEDETSIRLCLTQEGVPLAKLLMNDLNDKSNIVLTVEVTEDGSMSCRCTDKTTKSCEKVLVK